MLIYRDKVTELISSVHQDTLRDARLAQHKPDGLENLSVLVLSACDRYQRGESVSARQYLDGFAIKQLLTLIAAHDVEPFDRHRDELDPRRHLELGSPELAAEVLKVGEPVPEGALHLLEIASRELKGKAPALAWDNVTIVKKWISTLV